MADEITVEIVCKLRDEGVSRQKIADQFGVKLGVVKQMILKGYRLRNPDKAVVPTLTQEQQALFIELFNAGASDLDIAKKTGVFIHTVRPIRTALRLVRPTTPTKAYDEAEDIKWLEQFRDKGGRTSRSSGYVPTQSSMAGGFLW